jgi:hypothetical protein
LNADACLNTARRETGATKRRKTKPTTNTTTKIPFQTTNQRKNKTCETCDPTKFEVSYIFNNTPQNGRRRGQTEKKRERVHLLLAILVTALVFHFDTS